MLDGWADQQLARNLAAPTIAKRAAAVRAFAPTRTRSRGSGRRRCSMSGWATCGRCAGCGARRCVITRWRLRRSARYLTDPAYGWAEQCQARFGTHPVQVVHEWNIAVHVQDNEADPRKRAFTVDELQAFFDLADDQVVKVRGTGRKGWLPAFRDAALFKTAYAFGLRRNEVRMLDVADFGRNPQAPEFGEYGVCRSPARQGQEGVAAASGAAC